MKKIFLFILLVIICMASTCHPKIDGHTNIYFINKSNQTICYVQSVGGGGGIDGQLNCSPNGKLIVPKTFRILPDSISLLKSTYDKVWEQDLVNGLILKIVVIDDDTYSSVGEKFDFDCDSIKKYVPVLHCYLLTLEDLRRMNWTVVYPPEE